MDNAFRKKARPLELLPHCPTWVDNSRESLLLARGVGWSTHRGWSTHALILTHA